MVRRVALFLAVMVVAFSAYRAVQAQAVANRTIGSLDIDSDGKGDFVVFRPAERAWYVLQNPRNSAFFVTSSSSTAATDTLIPPADYNGDGRTDLATWRPTTQGSAATAGTWTVQVGPAFTSAFSINWGTTNDQTLPADWDGDGRFDVAYYNTVSKTLYVLQGGSNYTTAFSMTWGISGDIALPGDWDGDGRIDFAVWRPAEQVLYVLQGGTSFTTAYTTSKVANFRFGQTLLQGDFDGDGRMDLAAYTPATTGPGNVAGTWTIAQGGNNLATQFAVQWGGAAEDVLVPGDFDGDGRLDIAFYKPSDRRFYVLQGGTSYTTAFSVVWGTTGDTAIGLNNRLTIP